ncbi:PASTA domain-containing protein, partial [Nocardioides sp. R-C-SC26]|uniref:PASTA domain-containing protein n=1 Tax=Nocardioides sp. R-C-SC26 TaxID=2870414 RepID=UPI001E64787B
FQPKVEDDPSSTRPAGIVTRQFPDPQTGADEGSTVVILVSPYVEPPPPDPTSDQTDGPPDPSQPTDDPSDGLIFDRRRSG